MISHSIDIRPVIPDDVPILFDLIMALAEHEKLSHKVTGTCEQLHKSLFGSDPDAQAILACVNSVPTGFASSAVVLRSQFTQYSSESRPCTSIKFLLPAARSNPSIFCVNTHVSGFQDSICAITS